jgi:hypothetical protein
MKHIPLRSVKGRFYRAVRADRIDKILDPPGPDSAGRYHRHGQPALYITPEPDWAVIALGGYMVEDGLPRLGSIGSCRKDLGANRLKKALSHRRGPIPMPRAGQGPMAS